VALTRTEVVLRCGFVLRKGCCAGSGWITEEMLAAGYNEADVPCGLSGGDHVRRRTVQCGRPDAPPMAPDWDHQRWTGHAFDGIGRAFQVEEQA